MPRPDVGGACEAARLRASLALDGGLDDDLDLLLLDRHLSRCPECADVVADMRRAAAAVRRTPLLPHRCDLGDRRRPLPWANVAVAVMMIAVTGVVLPHAPDASRAGDGPSPLAVQRLASPPPPLPLGQRSAVEDFLPRPGAQGESAPTA